MTEANEEMPNDEIVARLNHLEAIRIHGRNCNVTNGKDQAVVTTNISFCDDEDDGVTKAMQEQLKRSLQEKGLLDNPSVFIDTLATHSDLSGNTKFLVDFTHINADKLLELTSYFQYTPTQAVTDRNGRKLPLTPMQQVSLLRAAENTFGETGPELVEAIVGAQRAIAGNDAAAKTLETLREQSVRSAEYATVPGFYP